MTYDDFNIDDKGLRFHADLDVESKIQSATLRLTLPPRVPQYSDTYSTNVAHTDISGLETNEFAAGWKRKTANTRDQVSYGVAFYASQQMPTNAESANAHALFFDYGRTWRNVDDLLSPARGYAINAQIGAAPPGVSTTALGRGVVQFAAWLPIDTKTELTFKAEGGAVAARNARDVPIAAAVPDRRRYDRARVTRSTASARGSAMRRSAAATTRSAVSKSCAGSLPRGASPRSSTPATPPIASPT